MDRPTQTNDHDLLVTLITKFDYMARDIKTLTDGTATQLANHEVRIKACEELSDKLNPIEQVKKLDEVYAWMRGVKANYVFLVGAVSILTGAVSFVIGNFSWLLHMGGAK